MKKKGELSDEVIGLIIGLACIIVLVSILWWLLAPQFNRTEKIAESYFNSLSEAIEMAQKGGTGEFSIWQDTGNTKFYVVYFGEKIKYAKDGISFYSLAENHNRICICYREKGEGEGVCEACKDLDYSAKLVGNNDEEFIIKEKENVKIYKATNENFFKFISEPLK